MVKKLRVRVDRCEGCDDLIMPEDERVTGKNAPFCSLCMSKSPEERRDRRIFLEAQKQAFYSKFPNSKIKL